MPTFDVVLHTNSGIFREGAQQLLESFPAVNQRIDLGQGHWMGHLQSDLVTSLMETCEPKMLGVSEAYRQYAHLYVYGRDLRADADILRWDHDHQLSTFVSMSRLIHPTSVGFRYAARVRHNGHVLSIVPAVLRGVSPDVFLSPSQTRDWLTVSEAQLLGELNVKAMTLRHPSFPERVSRALWYFDYAQRTYYADLRWTMIATALEALIHTGKANPTRHFKLRVPALAADVGAPSISPAEADEAYDFRSRLSHGDAFLYDMPKADINLYDKLEGTLRLAILKAFREDGFASVFLDESKIAARWPA